MNQLQHKSATGVAHRCRCRCGRRPAGAGMRSTQAACALPAGSTRLRLLGSASSQSQWPSWGTGGEWPRRSSPLCAPRQLHALSRCPPGCTTAVSERRPQLGCVLQPHSRRAARGRAESHRGAPGEGGQVQGFPWARRPAPAAPNPAAAAITAHRSRRQLRAGSAWPPPAALYGPPLRAGCAMPSSRSTATSPCRLLLWPG